VLRALLVRELVDAEPVDEDPARVDLVEPETQLSNVVLPEPDGPMTATNWPCGTTRSRPCRATIESAPDR
jgi:hypothetical protein